MKWSREDNNMSVKDTIREELREKLSEEITFEGARNISGTELAGEPVDAWTKIAAIVELLRSVEIGDFYLQEAETFEQLMVGAFLHKFHLMVEKQRGYGTGNIQEKSVSSLKAVRGILTRTNDKLQRAKNILGDPDDKLEQIDGMLDNLPDDARPDEMAIALNEIRKAIHPQEHAEESIIDTVLDLGNYGDIMFMVLMDAWGKPLEENTK